MLINKTSYIWSNCFNHVTKCLHKNITKNKHNFMNIQAISIKIDIWLVPYLLNNFTYSYFACLVWPKCWNYAMKLKKAHARGTVISCKSIHISMNIKDSWMKFDTWIIPYLLNNFTYTSFTCLVWLKCWNLDWNI